MRKKIQKTCQQCLKLFETTEKVQRFCSRSCAATFNNFRFPREHMKPFRKPKTRTEICECGNHKNIRSKICRRCANKIIIDRNSLRSLGEVRTTRGPSVYAQIREYAKSIMDFHKVPKKCVICGYDKYVEVCHIKKISSFSEDSLLSEINSLKNLIHLCPNHHKELDNNLLSSDELEIINKGS